MSMKKKPLRRKSTLRKKKFTMKKTKLKNTTWVGEGCYHVCLRRKKVFVMDVL